MGWPGRSASGVSQRSTKTNKQTNKQTETRASSQRARVVPPKTTMHNNQAKAVAAPPASPLLQTLHVSVFIHANKNVHKSTSCTHKTWNAPRRSPSPPLPQRQRAWLLSGGFCSRERMNAFYDRRTASLFLSLSSFVSAFAFFIFLSAQSPLMLRCPGPSPRLFRSRCSAAAPGPGSVR